MGVESSEHQSDSRDSRVGQQRPIRRALVVPVWRTAPSAETPKPSNDFNGVLALVIDLNRFVEVYLGPGD